MSSHDSFAPSGSSPTRKKKSAIPQADFRVEYHGSICLLVPLSAPGREWIEENVGQDNGFQPYYHPSRTIVVEPRFLSDIIAGIRRDGLVAR
jgi:hypothetical protein